MDIIEIDAASHTGVDNIREIIERAQFQPTKTKYKIYIVDEVHMLSKWAFNALLKILEEPPSHVKFILATTEIHKVPETILSRCQRYDFRNHTPEDTRNRLQYIATEEKVTIDEDSLEYIVKTSGGWLRNAISLFEQLIVGNKISYEYILQTLGVSKSEEIQIFSRKLINQDISAIEDFESLKESWKNIKLFFHDVLLYLENTSKKMLVSGEDITNILSVLSTLYDTYGKSKNSFDESLCFSIGVMKCFSYDEKEKGKRNQKHIEEKTSPQLWDKVQEGTSNDKIDPLFDNAQDIFSQQEPDFEEKNTKTKSITTKKPSDSISFETETFIAEVKKLWGKWAVTMSLRGSDMRLDGEKLIITTKTKIARNSLQTPEVGDVIHNALQSLGKENITFSVV